MNDQEAQNSINFIKKYRSYVINYNYGQYLIRDYIDRNLGSDRSPQKHWELFGRLLSNEIRPADLLKK
ncbi:MAG: hypothetical protein EOO43_24500 [Flavobacterium sp.]|nr:MAG: hypothetical protein EOO43_24500 [Flavobacterium sp.]